MISITVGLQQYNEKVLNNHRIDSILYYISLIKAPAISPGLFILSKANPAGESVNITCPNLTQCTNLVIINGQGLFTQKMTDRRVEMDTRNYENGIYNIVVVNDAETLTQKIVIQK